MIKEYVLRIRYDSDTEEVEFIKEYIEGNDCVFEIGDMYISVPEELSQYIESDILGLA